MLGGNFVYDDEPDKPNKAGVGFVVIANGN